MEYAPFTLLFDHASDDALCVRLLDSDGEDEGIRERLALPQALPEVSSILHRMGARSIASNAAHSHHSRGLHPPDDLDWKADQIGRAFFEGLIRGQIRERLSRILPKLSRRENKGLRITLRLNPHDRAVAPLLHYPWELLRLPDSTDYLCLDPLTPLVRDLDLEPDLGEDLLPGPTSPLRILTVASNPDPDRRLDLRAELTNLDRSLRGLAEIRHLGKPTHKALVDALREEPVQIVHFMGHGAFDPRIQRGWLLLENDSGEAHPVSADTLGRSLREAPDLLLVVLNACDSGTSPATVNLDPFPGLAPALIARGIPAVVGMQFTVSDDAAIRFSEALYTALAEGKPVEAAVTEGRLSLADTRELSWEWVTPVLYMRKPIGRLAAPIEEQPPEAPYITTSAKTLNAPIDFRGLLNAKTANLVDRPELNRCLEETVSQADGGCVLLRGHPGSGKTTALAEQVLEHGCAHHFEVKAEGLVGRSARVHDLAAQLVQRYGLPLSYLDRILTSSDSTLGRILARVSARLGNNRARIVLDLEEDRQGLTLEEVGLPNRLPPGVTVLIGITNPATIDTTEPGTEIVDLSSLPDHHDRLAEHVTQLAVRGGTRTFLDRQPVEVTEARELLAARAEGSFLYLDFVAEEFERGRFLSGPIESLPQGLTGYLDWKWGAMQASHDFDWTTESLPVLLSLVRAARPLAGAEVTALSGISDRRRTRRVLRSWAPLVTRRALLQNSPGIGKYALAHEAVLHLVERQESLPEQRDAFRRALLRVDRRQMGL